MKSVSTSKSKYEAWAYNLQEMLAQEQRWRPLKIRLIQLNDHLKLEMNKPCHFSLDSSNQIPYLVTWAEEDLQKIRRIFCLDGLEPEFFGMIVPGPLCMMVDAVICKTILEAPGHKALMALAEEAGRQLDSAYRQVYGRSG